MLTLPKILDIPPKLIPFITQFNDFRYFLIDGGRSSGKTQSIARFISYLCEQKSLRVVCGRETQTSLDESVYTVFIDLIRQFNLNFNVSATKIDHKVTGSAIRFRGFREQGATNIKGLEGVDILWVDESQAITKQTLDVIIPTIRKDYSRIIWSMNRNMATDPVYVAMSGRDDCLSIHCDYVHNPFCPEAMIKEAEVCKKISEKDYQHIWLGEPMAQGDDMVFSSDEVYGSPDVEFITSGIKKRILAVDVARFGEDETVFCLLESQNAAQWQMIYQDVWRDKNLMECVGKIIDMSRSWHTDLVVIDDCGIGGGVTDRLGELRMPVVAFNGASTPRNELYANQRAEAYFEVKELFGVHQLKIMKDAKLQEQLLSVRFKFMSTGGKKALISKDEMRKNGLKSPDRADALSFAVYHRNTVVNMEKDMLPSYGVMGSELDYETVGRERLPAYGVMQ